MFGFRNGDEAENASKLHGMPFDEFLDRRGSAELSRKHPADLGSGIRKSLGLQAEEPEKAGKARHVEKELDEGAPHVFRELAPVVNEVDQKLERRLRVGERIASHVRMRNLFLFERVTARERPKQRFQAQRVENRRTQAVEQTRADPHVAVDDVVTAHDVGAPEKRPEARRNAPVVTTFLGVDRAHVEAFPRLGIDFKIERRDAKRGRRARTVGKDETGIIVRGRQNKSHERVC